MLTRRWFLGALLLASVLRGHPAMGQGFSPEEAVRRMQVPPGFEITLAACEPEVRQPVTMTFDDRGRLWVIQYLQYPTPAGLKPVKVDQYLRTVYDRVPEPPPRGPRGEDRITIYEDRKGDGHFHKVKDFVTGLNLASGMALGYGGVFVAQPPYLLFYPDRDGDDVPDSDPEVLLTGFGMQDAHAFPNSLQFGPDGWLYGAHGSTVTANIRGVTFQQGIWRYHPRTREFELFAEGGGNTWGLDFDAHGNVIAGTNYGGVIGLHQVQGAYYVKGFAKHGELQNPYAFGYFQHIPHQGFKGGHVTCGGIVYEGGSFPKEFAHVYIAGNPLGNAVYWHYLDPKDSTFTSRQGGDFIIGNDTWFRPVDLQVGPDGAVYVADWYDKRLNHVDPVDNWDRSNGRIYRVQAKGAPTVAPFALSKLSSLELVRLLSHRNDWFVREARRILGERRDPTVWPVLRQQILDHQGSAALQALWALYVSGGFDDTLADRLLSHPNPDVRAWTVRFLGDARHVTPALAHRLIELARQEPAATVRCQLACTAKRLPDAECLAIVWELLHRSEDLHDPFIPLLLWWAIEAKAASDRYGVLHLLATPAAWQVPLIRQEMVERISRRYMAAGADRDLECVAQLLAQAPTPADADLVLRGMEAALAGLRLKSIPPPLAAQLARLRTQSGDSLRLLRIGLRLGDTAARARALEIIGDAKVAVAERIRVIEVLAQVRQSDCVPTLLRLLAPNEPAAMRRGALSALQAFDDPAITERVLSQYSSFPGDLRSLAQTLLCSRLPSAKALLLAVDQGRIAPRDVATDQLRRALLHSDEFIARLVEKHWGRIGPEPPGEKRARIASVKHMLGGGTGDPARGHKIFKDKCATCHTLFGEGSKVGPDLTGTDRNDRDFLVTSVVDPSAVIRNEYVAYVAATTTGRIVNGLLVESTPKTVTLLDSKNERTSLAREDIEELKPSPLSLMPEKLLDDLDELQIRDLFSYLQSNPPAAAKSSTSRKSEVLKVCLVSGSLEYHSDESLADLQKYLEAHYPIHCTRAFRKTDEDLPGLENLETCDVMLLFTRRLSISGSQLERIKRYCAAGKPIVAVRTASHAFQNWLGLDKEVLGGNYQGHYGANDSPEIHLVPEHSKHPILAGVTGFRSKGSLYRNTGLAADDEILLTGTIPSHTEPVAWVRTHKGGRVFYTSLGHPDDFKEASFVRLLVNALFWTTRHGVPPVSAHE